MPPTKANISLIDAALQVAASGLPVFPTNDKMPAWSNKDLGVGKGEGGYKVATTDPDRVRELFSHRNAKEIAVPMGDMSGMLCIDVDLHKGADTEAWWNDNVVWLEETRCHKTRSGGLHYFFKHVPNIKFPSQLAPGVDVKAAGNGYVCWPGTPGYEVVNDAPLSKFPMDVLNAIVRGTGSISSLSSYSSVSDDALIEAIKTAEDLYPALRSLSMRLPHRSFGGVPLSPAQQVEALQEIMKVSVAADQAHPRHVDWVDRYNKIDALVDSANYKQDPQQWMTEGVVDNIMDGPSIMGDIVSRPIGPQRETKLDDIEQRVAAIVEEDEEFEGFTLSELKATTLPAIEWLIEGMLPVGGIASLGGTSNVGKTRWLASLAACLSVGRTDLMGLPEAEPSGVVWIANEEHTDDIKRRIKAATQHYDIRDSGERIAVRPKTQGTFRLVALNEVGNPELDEENIARLVAYIRRENARCLFLDPYVTLSDAMDENSATSAAMLTKAMILVTSATGCAVIHAHHTPKDRSKDNDWYRGSSDAWRGSGAIYSALDCGFTLANWMPRGEQRKKWKEKYIDEELSRWVVLDTGKIREGKPLEPVVYELIGEELPEGYEIGVCHVSSAHNAENALLYSGNDEYVASYWANHIFAEFGEGDHHPKDIHERLKDKDGWVIAERDAGRRDWSDLVSMYDEPVASEQGYVEAKKKGRSTFVACVAKTSD